MTSARLRYRCFGLRWQSDIALAHFEPDESSGSGPVIEIRETHVLPERQCTSRQERMTVMADGFRFQWNDEVCFDYHASGQLLWHAGRDWTGELPAAFYSSVAAFIASSCGLLPLHASAFELSGAVWLAAGPPGAGKSTLLADVLASGGRMIADDLSVVRPPAGSTKDWQLTLGRTSMRLHPETMTSVSHHHREEVPDDDRGKWLVWPEARAIDPLGPIRGLVWLADGPIGRMAPRDRLAAAESMLFRPKLHQLMPGQADRRRQILQWAAAIPAFRMAPLRQFDEDARRRRLADIMQFTADVRA